MMSPRIYTRRLLVDRFRDHIITGPGCWDWRGKKWRNGYGVFVVDAELQVAAHRFAWELVNGPVPDGLWVLHSCDNPPCTRLDHLFLGDRKANMEDCARKGRTYNGKKTHCPKGHPYSQENTYRWLTARGTPKRECRTCHIARRERRKREVLKG